MSSGDKSEHERTYRFIENLHLIMKLAGISTTPSMFSGVGSIFYNFYLQALSLANLSPLSASAVISTSTECPSESVMFQCVMILNLKKKVPGFCSVSGLSIRPGACGTGAKFLVVLGWNTVLI